MDDVSKMSEAERLQLRKMRFSGTLGTDTTLEEAEKVCLTPRRSSRNAWRNLDSPTNRRNRSWSKWGNWSSATLLSLPRTPKSSRQGRKSSVALQPPLMISLYLRSVVRSSATPKEVLVWKTKFLRARPNRSTSRKRSSETHRCAWATRIALTSFSPERARSTVNDDLIRLNPITDQWPFPLLPTD